jgi:predicted metal-binding transcription factor (methanogenesis marker protein 9)
MCKMRISFAMKRMHGPRRLETCFGELIVHWTCKANLVHHPAPLDGMVMQTETRGLGVRLWMPSSVRINKG